jgi:NADPH:quinone reductase-like Zn-dependent oxidoreductase
LGASGGIGAHLVQLLKDKDDDPGGAGGDVSSTTTYVVGVTSRPDQLQPFVETGVLDEVIDYTKDDVFSLEKFRKADSKFDLVVDLAGCGYRRLEQMYGMGETLPVKAASDGGRFVTFVPPVGPIYEVHGVWTLLRTFLFPLLWKALTSRTLYRKSLPSYTFALALPDSRECVVRALELAGSGRLKPVVDGRGPHPFTTEGVREAFRIQQSRHATGKTLIRVSALDEDAAFSGFDGATT